MAGAELKEEKFIWCEKKKELLREALISYTDRYSTIELFLMSGFETQRKKRVKNIVNRYPICNKDFATRALKQHLTKRLFSEDMAIWIMEYDFMPGKNIEEMWVIIEHLDGLTELSDESHVENRETCP
ncbi:hypothetical protein BYT27DRAFT_7253397 [Phlegmacium glaucopus]|nr:hypothetical protein BYT27DRAFT_7253397 [Phlegmacium glaucopus]